MEPHTEHIKPEPLVDSPANSQEDKPFSTKRNNDSKMMNEESLSDIEFQKPAHGLTPEPSVKKAKLEPKRTDLFAKKKSRREKSPISDDIFAPEARIQMQ